MFSCQDGTLRSWEGDYCLSGPTEKPRGAVEATLRITGCGSNGKKFSQKFVLES